jgi:transposase
LYVAFELGNTEWKLAMTTSIEQAPLVRTMPSRELETLEVEIARAKAHFGLSATAPVRSCYEAGRDGFWLHRYLVSRGITNCIVDSSSIEVNRRRRRTKTDRLDACKLVTMLIRTAAGEKKVWSVVKVPSPTEEDRRQVHRELLFARRDRGRHTNRIKGLLASQGVPLARIQELPTHLVTARLWDETPLPPLLCARLEREWDAVLGYSMRIRALKKERRALLEADDPAIAQVRQLNQLRGIGIDSAWLYVMEFFAWREFHNRRQVGGLAGLTDTHYQSGDLQHEQGISKAGNRWVRALAINTAWAWLRFQPTSVLAKWYQQKFGHGSSRVRKIGIVALARKLLIAFWRYLETGVIPEGAMLRA